MSQIIKHRLELLIDGLARANHSEIPNDVNDLTKIWLLEIEQPTLNVSLMREQKHITEIQENPELYQEFPILLNMDKSHVFDIWFIKSFPYEWLLPITKYKLRYINLNESECSKMLEERSWYDVKINRDELKAFVDEHVTNNEHNQRILSMITNKIYDKHHNISFIEMNTNSDNDSFIYQVQAMYDDNIIMWSDWKLYDGTNDNPLSPEPFNLNEEKWKNYWRENMLKVEDKMNIEQWLESLTQRFDVKMRDHGDCRRFFYYIAYRKDADDNYSMMEEDWIKYVMNYWYLSPTYWVVRYRIAKVIER